MADFLLEIGCEEIPARMIDGAREELARRVGELLSRERLVGSPALEPYSTPRRIAVLARGIAASQPDAEEQVMGPAVKVAYKDGQPTPAAHAFAKKAGVDLDRVERVTTPKGEYLSAKIVKKGRSASEILSDALPKEIASLYWAKNMYWRPGKTSERFVRPVRWVVAMLGGETVPLDLFGTAAGKCVGRSPDPEWRGSSAAIASRICGEVAVARTWWRVRRNGSTGFAKRWTPPHERCQARAGVKTKNCSIPS